MRRCRVQINQPMPDGKVKTPTRHGTRVSRLAGKGKVKVRAHPCRSDFDFHRGAGPQCSRQWWNECFSDGIGRW